jgi:uncharacterized protein (DUF433 family)
MGDSDLGKTRCVACGRGSVMTDTTLLQRITARPDVFGGKPIIRDLRLSVALILSLLAQGVTPEALLEDYPGLELADIHACLAYAHAVIAGDSLDTIVGTPA